MRYRPLILALSLLGAAVPPSMAQVSVGVGIHVPGVNINVNLPLFPDLVSVPGVPVYYAPSVSANYFFYDGMYWVYANDGWYASSWYNGPWTLVEPAYVPVFVLRVPVRYYRVQPVYFRAWRPEGPPRWDTYWGPRWVETHRDWDRWDRRHVPPPAPIPVYQRQFAGDRYPDVVQPRQQLQLPAEGPQGAGAPGSRSEGAPGRAGSREGGRGEEGQGRSGEEGRG
jgi:hypothetical protein